VKVFLVIASCLLLKVVILQRMLRARYHPVLIGPQVLFIRIFPVSKFKNTFGAIMVLKEYRTRIFFVKS
jgi:hypothetical protein